MEHFEEASPQEGPPVAAQDQEAEAFDQEPKKRRTIWIVAALALVLVLGAAAYLAGQMMNRAGEQQGQRGGNGPRIAISKGGPGEKGVPVELDIKPAVELPQTQPEANGILTERKDNSLFLGTGNVTISASADTGDVNTDYDGPVVEVVVTQDTKIYRDITNIDPDNLEETIQQQVELATVEDIGGQANISAWGRKVGDRIIADVIFFSQPFMMKKPARSSGGN
jgi:hypothetical protein